MSYIKKYEQHHNVKIEKDWDVHHIDADRSNNDIENLIALPKEFHNVLHNWLGLLSRDHIEILLEWYLSQNRTFSHRALAYYLKLKLKRINKDKKLQKEYRRYVSQRKHQQAVSLKNMNHPESWAIDIY